MTYWKYWNLSAAPFTAAGHPFFRGQSIEEALARIEFLCAQRRNLATLVGPSGVGKSALFHHLVGSPPRESDLPAPHVCMVSLLGLRAGELAIELTKQTCGRKFQNAGEAWQAFIDCMATRRRGQAHTLLLIDDVENCGAEAENDLIRLVRAAEDKQVSIILSIETSLASTVSRWLLERSYLQLELPPWDLQQAREFVRSSLSRGGGSTTIFTDAAIARMHEVAHGIARRLSQLADLALIAGAVGRATRVDEAIVVQVTQEIPTSHPSAA